MRSVWHRITWMRKTSTPAIRHSTNPAAGTDDKTETADHLLSLFAYSYSYGSVIITVYSRVTCFSLDTRNVYSPAGTPVII